MQQGHAVSDGLTAWSKFTHIIKFELVQKKKTDFAQINL